MPSTLTPHCSGTKAGEVTGESGEQAGVPRLGQEFSGGVLSPAQLGTQSFSRAATLELYWLLHTLHSVSLSLIGFNERFNNTALPDQIKLLLSTALNPGSLLCNASMSQDPPFCKTPAACLLAHTFSPPLSPSCLFPLMSTPSKPEQADKHPIPKLHRQSSHKTGRIWRRMSLTASCWAQGEITPTGQKESDLWPCNLSSASWSCTLKKVQNLQNKWIINPIKGGSTDA